jgi:hypothetical protein
MASVLSARRFITPSGHAKDGSYSDINALDCPADK